MDLGVIDFVILIILISTAILGAFKGFISQLVSIISLVLGIWCASRFSPVIAEYIKNLFPAGETVIYIISFVVILLTVILLCTFIGRGIEKIVTFSMLGWLNRLLGILFSAAKAILILSLVAYLMNYMDQKWDILPSSISENSFFYPQLITVSERLFPYLQSIFS